MLLISSPCDLSRALAAGRLLSTIGQRGIRCLSGTGNVISMSASTVNGCKFNTSALKSVRPVAKYILQWKPIIKMNLSMTIPAHVQD